ncbi:MAG: dehydratase, partial [Rubrobacter sp.]|nr:dehydratase [Rubrobacter sp.]
MIRAYYDEISAGDGNVTRGRTITETDLVSFSMLSGDWFPLHTDAGYA